MNRHYEGRRKLIHLDAVMCEEMSHSADGTKCLREPMSANTANSKISRSLFPRPSSKLVKSCDQSLDMPDTAGVNCDYIGPSDIGLYREADGSNAGLNSNDSDNVDQSMQPKCSVDFVSARKYLNPTFNLLSDPVPQKSNSVTSLLPRVPTRGKTSRRPDTKRAPPTQKNSLDRYFKPVTASETFAADTQLYTTAPVESTAHCSFTPVKSPRKSILLSPLSKVPGSDNIYVTSPASKCSQGSQASSQSLSPAASQKSCTSVSALNNVDDDDADFEASFSYVWKTNPQMKRKPGKQSGNVSKKTSRAGQMDRSSRKLFDTQSMHSELTVAPILQQNNAILSDMSAENFGLFGFSNNTLLALDSDTDFEEDTTDYFSRLPLEVVSNIFCRLPFIDLCLNVNRVCVSWKNLIDSDDVSCGIMVFMIIVQLFNSTYIFSIVRWLKLHSIMQGCYVMWPTGLEPNLSD